jgi:hypothetical protein
MSTKHPILQTPTPALVKYVQQKIPFDLRRNIAGAEILFDGRNLEELIREADYYIDNVSDYSKQLTFLDRESEWSNMLQIRDTTQSVLESMEKCSGLLSPIRKIPDDLLCEIFTYLPPTIVKVPGLIDWDSGEALPYALSSDMLSVSAVCFYWYSFTRSMPSLWSKLSFIQHEPEESLEFTTRVVQLTQNILKKAGQHPLSLSLITTSFQMKTGCSSVIRDVFETSKRWSSLDIQLGNNILLEYLQRSSPKSFPLLHTLTFRAINVSSREVVDAFQNSPCLRTVSLVDVTACDYISLPWNQIRRFSLIRKNRRVTIDDSVVIACLQRLSNVESETWSWPFQHSHAFPTAVVLHATEYNIIVCA